MLIMESIIREIMRIANNVTLLRRSLADNIQVGNKAIDSGTLIAYNLNKMLYSEPLAFDPDRFGAPRQGDGQGNAVFLGWGTCRRPCTGWWLYFYSGRS
jgi:sterol 14-demethylase